MSGVPLLVITPNETRDLAGPVPLTEIGAVRRVPFDGGQAFFVEEGTTNLIPNPSFEAGLGAWTYGGSMARIEHDTTTSAVGSSSLKSIATADNNDAPATYTTGPLGTHSIEIEPSTTYTVSFWAKASREGQYRTYHSFRGTDGTSYGTKNENHNFTTEWQRFEYTFTTPDAPDIARTYMVFYFQNGTVAGDALWVDAVQFEPKPYATSFTHGDMGEGYSWTGTPHNSASVRELGRVTTSDFSAPWGQGAMYTRFAIDNVPTISRYVSSIGQIGSSLAKGLHTYIPAGNPFTSFRDGSFIVEQMRGLPVQLGETQSHYVGWDNENSYVDFRDGTGVKSWPRYQTSPPTGGWSANGSIFVGDSGHSSIGDTRGVLNGYVAAVIAYDRPLTEAEIDRLDSIPTSELTWSNIATPEMRVKHNGEVVRVAGMWTKRNGLLKETRLG